MTLMDEIDEAMSSVNATRDAAIPLGFEITTESKNESFELILNLHNYSNDTLKVPQRTVKLDRYLRSKIEYILQDLADYNSTRLQERMTISYDGCYPCAGIGTPSPKQGLQLTEQTNGN